MAKRLTEAHPLTKKLRAFEDYMRENNISLEWNGYEMTFSDSDSGQEAYIRDNEGYDKCSNLPWMFETKLIRED